MNDLQINIALAKAMGWKQLSSNEFCNTRKTGVYAAINGVFCFDYGQMPRARGFDYRDPVIFVAICKRWELQIEFPYKCYKQGGRFIVAGSIEKAAALCVIDLVKKGEVQ